MTHLKTLIASGLLATIAATSALAETNALPPLSTNEYINTRLIAAGIGHEIRETCPSISARMFYALWQAKKLQDYALDLGYSHDQIDSFINDMNEQRRVTGAVKVYMAENGVVEGNTESYCALGRAEIAKKSIAGSLLRAR